MYVWLECSVRGYSQYVAVFGTFDYLLCCFVFSACAWVEAKVAKLKSVWVARFLATFFIFNYFKNS